LPLKDPDHFPPGSGAPPLNRDEGDRSEAALLEEAMAQRARRDGTFQPETEAEIAVLRLGLLPLCFVPGEPLESVERGIVDRTGQKNLRVVGYSNGAPGYVFGPDEQHEGGYEVLSSPLTGAAWGRIVATGSRLSTVRTLLDELSDEEEPMLLAAQWCADAIAGGGLVHVFGAGHSHMAAEEAFSRAGGLVPVNAVLVEWLMVHQGGRRGALLERQPGLGELIVSTEPVEPGDVFFVVSNSGRNPVPVEVAEAAKRRSAKVVALTSRQHSAAVTARGGGGGGPKLSDVADLVIDTHAPFGDAAVPVDGDHRVGGVSSVLSLVIIQTIVVATITILVERGIQPPVFKSGNVDGSDEWNAEQIKRLGRRVPTLLRSSVG
jgi:uncharacterized phosphosugar-binding protein